MGNGGATLKKRDLIVTLLYFLDMAVLILSVMFSIWMRNEFRVETLAKEITRGSFWLSMVVLAVIYACVFTLSRTYQVLWEYASMRDACMVAVCAMSSSIAPHCAEISVFCAEHIYYGCTAFGRRRGGCQNGAQNAQTQAVEGHYAQVEPQQHYDNRCRRRCKYIDPRDKNKSRYGILSGLYS